MQRSNNRPTTTFINFSLYSRHTRAHAHAHTEKITFTEKDTVLTVKEGQTATILCELKGEPQPNVTWHFNGQPISVEGESPILMSFTQRCSLIFWIFSLYCGFSRCTRLSSCFSHFGSKRFEISHPGRWFAHQQGNTEWHRRVHVPGIPSEFDCFRYAGAHSFDENRTWVWYMIFQLSQCTLDKKLLNKSKQNSAPASQ